MTSTDWDPDVPGRGAWTLRGGLINNSGGVVGYYQMPDDDSTKPPPGSQYVSGEETGDSYYVVYLAIKGVQRMLNSRLELEAPITVSGVWDQSTQYAISTWQEINDLEPPSGILGPRTTQFFYRPQMVHAGRKHSVPWRFLYGMTSRESGFDPAAVGVNGYDHGLVQINLEAHGDKVSREQAVSAGFCYNYAARGMRAVYNTWESRTQADPWDIAIANHNSPALAQRWAETGEPPYVEGRIFQIEDYVIDIRARADTT